MDTNKLERLAREGQLAETREKIKESELRLKYIGDALRRELDPFEPVENLKPETIKLIFQRLKPSAYLPAKQGTGIYFPSNEL